MLLFLIIYLYSFISFLDLVCLCVFQQILDNSRLCSATEVARLCNLMNDLNTESYIFEMGHSVSIQRKNDQNYTLPLRIPSYLVFSIPIVV